MDRERIGFLNQILIMTAVVILLCVFLNRISNKLGIPVLLAFILLGMVFGSDGLIKIPFDNYEFVEKICSAALIFIMFYGGFGTNWNEAKPVAAKAILLSTLGVILTAGFTGLFCHFVLGIKWIESFLIGALLGSTDAASVFSILRSKRLNLRYNTASLLEVESGSNDPCAYMMTAVLLAVMQGTASGGKLAYMIFAQIVYGLIAGAVIAFFAIIALKKFRFTTAGFDTVFVVAVAVLAYALPSALGGNGYLSTYIVGIILGNANIKNKKTLVPFFDGINGLMQMLIFFLLGLLSFPSKLLPVVVPSLLIAVFMTFVSRPLAVFSILTPFKSKISQQLVVSWCGLRGAASIVFAVMAMMTVNTENDVFHIVFCVVLFSILLQGSLLPLVAKKLNMIDNSSDVMKTFNDYCDEEPVQFIKFKIAETHKWCGKSVKDILLPPDTILVLLIRGDEHIVPNGKTKLLKDDIFILCAKSTGNIKGVQLTEKHITAGDKYIGTALSDIKDNDMLIIMIKRKGKVIIPQGNTQIKKDDILVLNHRTVEE